MTDRCEGLRDRMPDVAAGRAVWAEADSQHLSTCAECGAEWRLIQASRRLGEERVRQLDLPRMAGAVRAGVARERRRARYLRGGWFAGLAAAAAVVLLLWYRPPEPGQQVASGAGQRFTLPLAELEGLDAGQLNQVLDGLEVPLEQGGGGDVPTFTELDDQQLERVLRSLEG